MKKNNKNLLNDFINIKSIEKILIKSKNSAELYYF